MHLDPNLFDISFAMVVEKLLRAVVIYFALVVLLRIGGKRELAQLNPFDFVVILTLSNSVQNAIIGNDNSSLLAGVIGAAALMFVNWAFVALRVRIDSAKIDALVEGTEDVLIQCGEVDVARLRKELMTKEDLEIAARKQGFRSLDEIDFAALEPGGNIFFVSKSPTPADERFRALFARLDELKSEVRALRSDGDATGSS